MSLAAPAISLPIDRSSERVELERSADTALVRHRHLWILIGLTVFGGVLRFTRLDRPTFWIDEAFTYWRVSGTYAELIDILQDGGFTPLHYQAIWVLGQFTELTPFVMRLIPAVCGTLMIPAMYFLARQVAGRRVALLTAAFTACSAYMLNYSRDAKMYMDCWLFAALHLGCLMWWLRTRRLVAWLGWIAAGLAMSGIHATSLILLVAQPVLLLTSRDLKWPTTLLFLAGIAVIGAGPGGYYVMFNQWTERIEQRGWGSASGLQWVDWYNAGRGGAIDHLRFPGSAFLFSWEWPKATEEPQINPTVLFWFKNLGLALLVLILAGLFPWKGAAATAGAGNDTAPESAGNLIAAPPASAPESWWRGTLWICSALVLPLWLMYMVSAGRVVSPTDALAPLNELFDSPSKIVLAVIVLVAAFSCCGVTMWQRFRKTALLLMIVGVLLVACWFFGSIVQFRKADSVWVPRYLGMVWPAFAVAVCVALSRLPGRPLRWCAIAVLLGLNLVNYAGRLIYRAQPPLDEIASDVVRAHRSEGASRTFLSNAKGFVLLAPGPLSPEGRYYLCQAAGVRLRPVDFLQDNFNFRSDRFVRRFDVPLEVGTSARGVLSKLEETPDANRIILWDQFTLGTRPSDPGDAAADPVAEALGEGWRRIEVTDYPVYNAFGYTFSWAYSHTWRRREYVREKQDGREF